MVKAEAVVKIKVRSSQRMSTRHCLVLLPSKISGFYLEKYLSYGYLKFLTSNIEIKAEAEVKIEIRYN